MFCARSTLIDWREAREAPCEQFREQLSVLRGGALRRKTLRRHLQGCPGCRAFRHELKLQRGMIALIVPVVPSAWLKGSVLAAGVGGTATGGGASGRRRDDRARGGQPGSLRRDRGSHPRRRRRAGHRSADGHSQGRGEATHAAGPIARSAARDATSNAEQPLTVNSSPSATHPDSHPPPPGRRSPRPRHRACSPARRPGTPRPARKQPTSSPRPIRQARPTDHPQRCYRLGALSLENAAVARRLRADTSLFERAS